MKNNKNQELLELIISKGFRVETIDLTSTNTSSYNPLELGFINTMKVGLEDDIDKQLDENIIPFINSVAQIYKGFNLSEIEVTKIKEIVTDGFKNQKNLDIRQLRDEMIKQNNNNLDLSRVIELLNHFL